VPVLVEMGVKEDGLRAGKDFFEGLISRGLNPPSLVIIDGHKGLRAAVEKNSPGAAVQRCTVRELRNLERYAPRHAYIRQQMRLRAAKIGYKKRTYPRNSKGVIVRGNEMRLTTDCL
jgi:transposase-like protein